MDNPSFGPISPPASSLYGVPLIAEAQQEMLAKPSRSQIYSKEQWQALKPIIEQLYVVEGQTFVKVAQYLVKHHNFRVTEVKETFLFLFCMVYT
jgi:hypothetical protein